MTTKRGLGKGLEALFPEMIPRDDTPTGTTELPIDDIRPATFQPRRDFPREQLEELSKSIKTHGVLQPVVVRQIIGGYELVAGERRWRAAKMAGLATIPALVHQLSDGEAMEVALIENIQREDLNPIEEGEAFRVLLTEFALTQEDLSQRIGKSRSHIANTMRLLNLPAEIKEHVSRGTISMGHARALLALKNTAEQIQTCQAVVNKGLSVRETEALVRKLTKGNAEKAGIKKKRKREPYIVEIENTLQEVLGTRVEIKAGAKKGRIEIEYYTAEDLDRIYQLLTGLGEN